MGYDFLDKYPSLLVPAFNGKKGHPPLFHAKLKSEFLNLDNDAGVNTIAHQHQEDTVVLPVADPGVIKSFNTVEEFAQLKREMGL